MEVLTAREKKAAYMKAWREANRDQVKANLQRWKAENKEAQAEYQKKYHAEYRERDGVQQIFRERHLRKNYRLTTEDFNDLWNKQKGKCGACSVDMSPRGREGDSVCVDHNHETGMVRWLLCRSCNHGIGCLKDCPEVMERAAKYLRENGNYSTSLYRK